MIGINRSTLYRSLEQEGIDHTFSYSSITDINLDETIESIRHSHPNDSEWLIIGHLQQRGIVVQRYKIRALIHRVDPIETAVRRSRVFRRRVYQVEGPNSLWHIDSNNKLINWRFIVHGAIDGYSRTDSTNNLAATVMSSFYQAVYDHGVSDQIRSDLVGENVEVWRYMTEQKHFDSAVLVCSSTHNQRIDLLWRDSYRCVLVLYADLFKLMVADNRLSSLIETDPFCLHTVLLPRINQDIKSRHGVKQKCKNLPLVKQNVMKFEVFILGGQRNDQKRNKGWWRGSRERIEMEAERR